MIHELYVADSGTAKNPDLPTILLLHAFPCDHTMWAAQTTVLVDAGFRVLAPDFPGFGESPPAPGDPDLAAAAQAVFDVLDDRAVGSAAVAGLSLGGYLAMEMLRQQPGRLTRLALVDTKAGVDTPDAQNSREVLAEAVESAGSSKPLEGMLTKLLGQTTLSSRPEVVAQVGDYIHRASPQAIAWAQRAMAARPDSGPVLANYTDPALLLWGQSDSLSSMADQEYMLDSLPNARLDQIPDCGHLSALECPEAVSQALLDFMKN